MSHAPFKTTVGYTAVALALVIPTGVLAENSPNDRPFNNRFYLGAGIGATELQPEPSNDSLSVSDKNSNSFSLNVGYDISPRFTVDAYASSMGKAGISFLGDEVDDIDYSVYGISLISYLFNAGSPYSDNYDNDGLYQREGLSAYLRLGIGGMSNSSEEVEYERDHTAHFASGLGLEYGWSNGFAARAELSAYDKDARKLSISLLKRFGDASYASVMAASAPAIIPVEAIKAATPEPVANPVDLSAILEKPLVLFAFDDPEVKQEYVDSLEAVAAALTKHPEIQVQIDGHTDWLGSDTYNLHLSQLRANTVREFLINRGVDPGRLHTTGYGEQRPLADNNTEQGRSRNRRVELSRIR